MSVALGIILLYIPAGKYFPNEIESLKIGLASDSMREGNTYLLPTVHPGTGDLALANCGLSAGKFIDWSGNEAERGNPRGDAGWWQEWVLRKHFVIIFD